MDLRYLSIQDYILLRLASVPLIQVHFIKNISGEGCIVILCFGEESSRKNVL